MFTVAKALSCRPRSMKIVECDPHDRINRADEIIARQPKGGGVIREVSTIGKSLGRVSRPCVAKQAKSYIGSGFFGLLSPPALRATSSCDDEALGACTSATFSTLSIIATVAGEKRSRPRDHHSRAPGRLMTATVAVSL